MQAELVFVHKGNSWYLPFVLRQACRVNQNERVTLIGDPGALQCLAVTGGLRGESIEGLDQSLANEFVRNYVHMSSNSVDYELFCWLRWFYLLAYMQKHAVDSVIYMDSDVVTYVSSSAFVGRYMAAEKSCGYMVARQVHDSFVWAASPHISFWTQESLKRFCEFSIQSFSQPAGLEQYRRKCAWHQTQNEIGGICDMTTLYLFWRENQSTVENLAVAHQGHVLDHNMNSGGNYSEGEYALDERTQIKQVKFSQGKPVFQRTESPFEYVVADALHFQGYAKKFIPDYCLPSVRWPLQMKSAVQQTKRRIFGVVRRVIGR